MRAKELLKEAEKALLLTGSENARQEAGRLLSEVTGADPLLLRVEDREIGKEQEDAFRALLKRRAEKEPLQYILGIQYFMGFPFRVNPDVLIPRFDTESMCEDAVRLLPPGARVLDLCTGSGALAVSIARLRPDTRVFASDLSEAALRTARKNAADNHADVVFFQGDLFAPFEGVRFDAIISNPPYIPEGDIPSLSEEVRKEPHMALSGGEDGLDFYRRIAEEAPRHLTENGLLWLETGDGEAEKVRQLLREAFSEPVTGQDLSGLDRWVRVRRDPV